MPGPSLGALLPSFPLGPTISFLLDLSFQDFTSSQSWSVESSTSDSPTSIAMIKEMSESLLTAGSCSLLVVKMTSPSWGVGSVSWTTCKAPTVRTAGSKVTELSFTVVSLAPVIWLVGGPPREPSKSVGKSSMQSALGGIPRALRMFILHMGQVR